MGRISYLIFVIATMVALKELGVHSQLDLGHLVLDVGDMGKIMGLQGWTSQKQEPFFMFLGVPYAENTAAKRFQPSSLKEGPLGNETNPYRAWRPMVMCPQPQLINANGTQLGNDPPIPDRPEDVTIPSIQDVIMGERRVRRDRMRDLKEGRSFQGRYAGQEDCLVLNIYTPFKNLSEIGSERYPVIFYIHGGSSTLLWGAPFTGFRLMEHKVVLVSINYRLGVLGGLNLGVTGAPGNAGMYDAITALKWVQKYIHHFGGDKNRVVAAGHSAGGMMVTHLLISPMAKDLIHGVWGASGSALSAWATAEIPHDHHHLRVAYHADCYDLGAVNNPEIAACMQGKDAQVLVDAYDKYLYEEMTSGRMGYDTVVPSVQKSGSAPELFLAEDPLKIMKEGRQNDIPLVMGAARHDGSFILETIYRDFIQETGVENNATFIINEMVPMLLGGMRFHDESGAMYHALLRTYVGEEAMYTGVLRDMIPGLVDIISVYGFKAQGYQLVELNARVNSNSWFYAFDFLGQWSFYGIVGDPSKIPGGVAHVDDINYIFQVFPLLGRSALNVMRRYVQYWVNFATFLNPNGDPSVPSEEPQWPVFNEDTNAYFIIDRIDSVGEDVKESWIGVAKELGMPEWDQAEEPTTTEAEVTTTTEAATSSVTPSPTTNPSTTPGDSGSATVTATWVTVVMVSYLVFFV